MSDVAEPVPPKNKEELTEWLDKRRSDIDGGIHGDISSGNAYVNGFKHGMRHAQELVAADANDKMKKIIRSLQENKLVVEEDDDGK